MYHIKKDKRCRQSAMLIAEALSQCLTEKEFSKVTVTDIQKKSGVSRATFYRLFDHITDILSFQCDQYFDSLYEKCFKNDYVSVQILLNQFLLLWMEHVDLLELIVGINRVDIFYDCHMRHFEQLQQNMFRPDSHGYLDEYYVAITSGMLISVLLLWVKRGKQETAEEIHAILRLFLKSLLEHRGKFDISQGFFQVSQS